MNAYWYRTALTILTSSMAHGAGLNAPLITPGSGTFPSSVIVTMQSQATGAKILYTTDGTTPNEKHALTYKAPFQVATSTVIIAMAVTSTQRSGTSISILVVAPPVTKPFYTVFGTKMPTDNNWTKAPAIDGMYGLQCTNGIPQQTSVPFFDSALVMPQPDNDTLTVPGLKKTLPYREISRSGSPCTWAVGTQMQTTVPIYYGWFEAQMQTAQASGVVNSFFTFKNNAANEIDVEILSKENSMHVIHLTVHLPNNRKRHARQTINFDPSAAPHRYGFFWQPTGIAWFVDGVKLTIAKCEDENQTTITPAATCFDGFENAPHLPAILMFNNWTDGGTWSGTQPTTNAPMIIRSVSYKPY